MTQKLPLIILLALGAAYPLYVSADNPSKPQSFGVQVGVGGIEFRGSSYDGDGISQVYGFYNYAFTENFIVEVGLNVGADIDDWDCYEDENDDWHCSTNNDDSLFGLDVDEVEYFNSVAAVKGVIPVAEHNSLYGKIGAHYYDYEISRRNRTVYDDTGIGLYLAAGWQYKWDMGIGMNAGIETYDMDELDSTTLNVGINYSF